MADLLTCAGITSANRVGIGWWLDAAFKQQQQVVYLNAFDHAFRGASTQMARLARQLQIRYCLSHPCMHTCLCLPACRLDSKHCWQGIVAATGLHAEQCSLQPASFSDYGLAFLLGCSSHCYLMPCAHQCASRQVVTQVQDGQLHNTHAMLPNVLMPARWYYTLSCNNHWLVGISCNIRLRRAENLLICTKSVSLPWQHFVLPGRQAHVV